MDRAITGHPFIDGRRVTAYLELFKPLKQDLRWSRRLTLTKELMPMIKAAQVKRNGIAYAAPLPVWEAEMLRMAARPPTLTLPLTGHGYLLKVLANKGEQNAAALEKTVEQQRQNRVVSVGGNNELPPVDKDLAEKLTAEADRKDRSEINHRMAGKAQYVKTLKTTLKPGSNHDPRNFN